ncbi:DUF721 domain-containing protein [Pseudomonas sp. BMS12]|uniref:DUF721 domain-containing protein n=1 Tax=Pseudomonas sp. BMS12 TaxID=1796033 RepID=UPI00083B21D9|nr:DciA family protein [Pseudomonas sp. BMS12]
MSSRLPPAKTPSALLREHRPLQALFSAAQRLGKLQALVEAQLEPAAREHCLVASWQDGCLLLLTSNGHWATRLHYQQRRLQRALQQLPEFAELQKIQVKVRPPNTQVAYQGHPAELSQAAAESLNHAAEGIGDPKLRAALERLARNARREE